jgi:ATP-binding cassette, subfamily B, bacterial MsbA
LTDPSLKPSNAAAPNPGPLSSAAAILNAQGKPRSSGVLMRRLLRDHVRPHAGRLALAVFMMVLVAASTASLAKLIEPVLDDVFTARDPLKLQGIAIAIFATFAVKGVASYCESVLMNTTAQRIIADLQTAMLRRLMDADLSLFRDIPTGVLISRLNNDTVMLRGAVSNVLTSVGKDSLSLLFLVALMFYQDWMLSLIAFVAFPTAILPIARIGKRMRRVSGSTQVELGEFTATLEQVFQGIRHVKAYGMERYEAARAQAGIEKLYTLVRKAGAVRAISSPVMETLGGLAIVSVILYGGAQVIDGSRTTGAFFSFITALLLAYEPMKRLANLNANLQEGLAAAERVFTVLDLRPEIRDAPDAVALDDCRGHIQFEDVSFAYRADVQTLDRVTIDIPAGTTAALVGPSGAGKSTLLNLLPRFYDIGSGRLTVDGHDVRSITMASLRANIALVSQEVSLFNDTVRANIAYGRPNASLDDVIAAARQAAADDFIQALPEGYDTPVGEFGVRLSGGQRQRIAIARAMLKNAPILLLDEATSALDTESERQVQTALKTLMRGRTSLVIAHRLSTVVDADVIYVIERGRVVEFGSHADLIARNGSYARLYALQFADAGSNETVGVGLARNLDAVVAEKVEA